MLPNWKKRDKSKEKVPVYCIFAVFWHMCLSSHGGGAKDNGLMRRFGW